MNCAPTGMPGQANFQLADRHLLNKWSEGKHCHQSKWPMTKQPNCVNSWDSMKLIVLISAHIFILNLDDLDDTPQSIAFDWNNWPDFGLNGHFLAKTIADLTILCRWGVTWPLFFSIETHFDMIFYFLLLLKYIKSV